MMLRQRTLRVAVSHCSKNGMLDCVLPLSERSRKDVESRRSRNRRGHIEMRTPRQTKSLSFLSSSWNSVDAQKTAYSSQESARPKVSYLFSPTSFRLPTWSSGDVEGGVGAQCVIGAGAAMLGRLGQSGTLLERLCIRIRILFYSEWKGKNLRHHSLTGSLPP